MVSPVLCIRQSLSFPRWKVVIVTGTCPRNAVAVVMERAAETPRPAWICPQWPPVPKARCLVVHSAQPWGQPSGTGQEDGVQWSLSSQEAPPTLSHTPWQCAWAELRTGRNRADYLSDIPGSLGWGCICGRRWERPCLAPFKRPGVMWWPLVGLHELAWPSWLS